MGVSWLVSITLEAKEAGVKLNLMDFEKMSGRFVEEQLEGLGKESYSQEVDESVILFAQMLAEKKIEIRISPEKNIHSKIYILREDEIKKHDGSIDYRGSVITGSSNLSENGLTKNFEFNVELRDSDDIGFALEEFNNLWAGAVEITEKDVESIKAKSHLKEVTPYELYKKEEELREDCRSLHTEPLHQGAELPRQAVVQKGLSTFRNSFTSISLADDGLKEICTAYRFCGGWR